MGRGTDPKLAALKAVPLFAGMSKKDLAAVGKIADEIELAPGYELIKEGRVGSQFFVLLEGEAEVRRRGRKVNWLRKGDFFGEIALLADRPTTASVTAAGPVRVVVVTRQAFRQLLRSSPTVHWTVTQALVKRVPVDDELSRAR